jgi:hypothetical protein
VVPHATIHPEIQHHDHAPDTEYYLLPAVFTYEKGDTVTARYPGPGVYYFTEGEYSWPHYLSYLSNLLNGIGEIQYEDTANPGKHNVLKAGAVVHIEEGSVLRWYTPSVAKGQCYFERQFCHSLTLL